MDQIISLRNNPRSAVLWTRHRESQSMNISGLTYGAGIIQITVTLVDKIE